MRFATILAMAATAIALPYDGDPPKEPQDYFSLVMTVGLGSNAQNTTVSVLQNNTQPGLYLVGDGPFTPSPPAAYFTGSNPHKLALQVAVSGAAYGVDVAEIGDQQKVAEPVIVSPGYREFEFQVIGGKIFHDLSAGSNMWLYCDAVINGEHYPVLAWGSMGSDGSSPRGCAVTSLYQRFAPTKKDRK